MSTGIFESDRGVRPTEVDSLKLMRWLAKLANADVTRFRRMVLVLDVDDMPRLYTETFLQEPAEPPPDVTLTADEAVIATGVTEMQLHREGKDKVAETAAAHGKEYVKSVRETTNQHNEKYRTFKPTGRE